MFHNIPQAMLDRMHELEAKDSQDRIDGTQRLQRLRQIPPDTGKFIALLAANVPPGRVILGLPWYGRAWSTTSAAPRSATRSSRCSSLSPRTSAASIRSFVTIATPPCPSCAARS